MGHDSHLPGWHAAYHGDYLTATVTAIVTATPVDTHGRVWTLSKETCHNQAVVRTLVDGHGRQEANMRFSSFRGVLAA